MRLSIPLSRLAAALALLLQLGACDTTAVFAIPATNAIPNPFTLPPQTHATLSSLRASHSAPLSTANTFVFRNVTPGSYLVDVHCPTFAFVPLRLDVIVPEGAENGGDLVLRAWETYRGNDWDNKGEAFTPHEYDGYKAFHLKVLGGKTYFMERQKFSVLTIFKNPMILLGLVSMLLFFGMPYLVDNMDPEMRAEFEERQKNNPMNSILGGGAQPGAGGFDLAGMLAGSKKESGSGAKR